MYIIYPQKYIWGLKEWRIVLIATVLLSFAVVKFYGKIGDIGDSISLLLILLCISFGISASFAAVSQDAALDTAFIFLKLVIFWMLLKAVFFDLDNLDKFYWTAMLSLSFLALWGVEQSLRGNTRLEDFGGGQISGSNQLASALVWGIPIAYYQIFLAKKKILKILSFFCTLALLAGVVFTESRQGFVAILLYCIMIFVQSKRKLTLTLSCLLIGVIGINFVPSTYFERMDTIKEYEEDASAMGRLEQWKAATKVWVDHPIIGVGAKNYLLIAPRYTEHPRVTHNTFFQILAEEGTLGIGLFVALMCVTIVTLSKIIWRYIGSEVTENENRILHYALIARMSLLGILVCCIFQNKAEHEILYWSSAVAAALSSILQRQGLEISHREEMV